MRIDAPGTEWTIAEREAIGDQHLKFLAKRKADCQADGETKAKKAKTEKRTERLSACDMINSWQNALIGHTG